MNYWWVNHKQTHSEEIDGGYIWSPKKNANGSNNNSYNNMPKTSVGDIVFSFAYAEIRAIGKIIELCKTSPKPSEFGSKGDNWNEKGWLVKISWSAIDEPFRAKDNIAIIRPHLANKYAPIQGNGNGNQGCYLAQISEELADVLFTLSCRDQAEMIEAEKVKLDDIATQKIEQNESLTQSEKEQLIKARRGQGKYKRNLEKIESKCRITGLEDKHFLIASHSKPWSKSNNIEKIDGNNGFLFSPHADRLYDRGWISFSNDGELLISEPRVIEILNTWGIEYPQNIGSLSEQQKFYVTYHRDNIFCGGK